MKRKRCIAGGERLEPVSVLENVDEDMRVWSPLPHRHLASAGLSAGSAAVIHKERNCEKRSSRDEIL